MLRFNEEPGGASASRERESGVERAGANLDTTPFPFNSSKKQKGRERKLERFKKFLHRHISCSAPPPLPFILFKLQFTQLHTTIIITI
jgi:hypothetical protein